MRPTERPRFTVCCIANLAEAQLAEIAAGVAPGVDTFLLTARQDVDAIVAQHRAVGTTTVQLVDDLPSSAHARLRRTLPGTRLVQVVHVTGPESLDYAERAAEHVHAVLLDSGNPALAVKELGGTGRRHDWTISALIRERLEVPVLLAGGLTPDNAAEALATVGPYPRRLHRPAARALRRHRVRLRDRCQCGLTSGPQRLRHGPPSRRSPATPKTGRDAATHARTALSFN